MSTGEASKSAASKRVHWMQLVLLFLASLKSGKGICFEGMFLHLFKGSQRKGYQSGRQEIGVFIQPPGTGSWLYIDNLYPNGVIQFCSHHGALWTLFGCTHLYSLFQFLCQGRNRAAQGCDLRAGMAVYPTQTGFKGAILWHYRWTQWHCPGSAAAYCVTLLRSLPSSCSLWLTH